MPKIIETTKLDVNKTSEKISVGKFIVNKIFNEKNVIIKNLCGYRVKIFIKCFNKISQEKKENFIILNNYYKKIELDSSTFYIDAYIKYNGIWCKLWNNRKFDITTNITITKYHVKELNEVKDEDFEKNTVEKTTKNKGKKWDFDVL